MEPKQILIDQPTHKPQCMFHMKQILLWILEMDNESFIDSFGRLQNQNKTKVNWIDNGTHLYYKTNQVLCLL